jgi:hypothetical protein
MTTAARKFSNEFVEAVEESHSKDNNSSGNMRNSIVGAYVVMAYLNRRNKCDAAARKSESYLEEGIFIDPALEIYPGLKGLHIRPLTTEYKEKVRTTVFANPDFRFNKEATINILRLEQGQSLFWGAITRYLPEKYNHSQLHHIVLAAVELQRKTRNQIGPIDIYITERHADENYSVSIISVRDFDPEARSDVDGLLISDETVRIRFTIGERRVVGSTSVTTAPLPKK